ncbi:MAG: type II secretion system protein [Gemmataceae bacterium]|nr:type II secretion system protein [Gemmataceae bacterium]
MIRTEQHLTRRAGFTLMELLVVIAIIAVLASMVSLGVFAMIGNRTKSNTEANVRVLHKLLQTRWAAVVADAKKETPSLMAQGLAGGDLERARVIWIKIRLAEAFPINYSEMEPDPKKVVNIVNTYIPANKLKPHFVKYRTTITAYPPAPGPTEPSACLLMALRTLQTDGVSLDDQMKNAVADTDGDGIPELVDGWGRPLAFFRFPWNDAALQAANPAAANSAAAKFSDPADPTGKLLLNKLASNWYKDTTPFNPPIEMKSRRVLFEFLFHPIMVTATDPLVIANPAIMTPKINNAYYTTPVIASAGKDGLMLYSDFSSAGAGSADNILSFQLRGD